MSHESRLPTDSRPPSRRRIPPLWMLLLALIAVVGVGLGITWWRIQQRNWIVDYAHHHDGYVVVDIGGTLAGCRRSRSGTELMWSKTTPRHPDWLVEFIGPAQFYPLKSLVVRGAGARPSPRMMAELSRFPQFDTLWLCECPARDFDAQFAEVRRLSLRKASLSRTHAGDQSLQHLQGMNSLEYLDLTRTRVSDRGLRYLAKLPNLKTVNLSRSKVTLEGAEWLKQQQPGCEIIWQPLPSGRRVTL